MTTTRAVPLLAVAVVLVAAGACGHEGVGLQPIAVHETATQTLPRVPVGPDYSDGSTASPSTAILSTVDACGLVPPAVVTSLGASGPGQDHHNYGIFASDCEWQVPGRYAFGVAITTAAGIDNVAADGAKTPVTVGDGRHRAIQSRSGVHACAISIEVTGTSRVDTQASPSGHSAEPCRVAKALANAVEPRLPAQQG